MKGVLFCFSPQNLEQCLLVPLIKRLQSKADLS